VKEDIRILVIDDELAIRDVLKMNLKREGYQICEAVDGASGLTLINAFHPHLILLDLGLPDISGLQVLEELRKWTRVPTIVLTASWDEQTKVSLLDAGADDYLTKPFGTQELLARVRVALRNLGLIEASPLFQSEDLEVDLAKKQVRVSGKDIKLTVTEYELLSRLVRDHGKVVPQSRLLKEIWGSFAQDETHYLRVYINQLRKKIEVDPSVPRHILTESGVGYRLV